MKSAFVFLLITLSYSWVKGQGNLALSQLKVVEITDPGAGEVNKLMVELNVSNPALLKSLQVRIERAASTPENISHLLSVTMKDGIPSLNLPEYTAPFDGSAIRFFLPVADQLKLPLTAVLIEGVDANGSKTNQVVYRKDN